MRELCFRYGALAVALAVASGCGRSPSRSTYSSAAPTTEKLLHEVVATLDKIDTFVSLDVRPPKVVLDSKNSGNQDIVQAKLIPDPENPDGLCSYLEVVTGNSRFRGLEVRPGDYVR